MSWRTRPNLEPWCPLGVDYRHDPDRKAEFSALVSENLAPATRSWIIWMNQVYRYNCELAGVENP